MMYPFMPVRAAVRGVRSPHNRPRPKREIRYASVC